MKASTGKSKALQCSREHLRQTPPSPQEPAQSAWCARGAYAVFMNNAYAFTEKDGTYNKAQNGCSLGVSALFYQGASPLASWGVPSGREGSTGTAVPTSSATDHSATGLARPHLGRPASQCPWRAHASHRGESDGCSVAPRTDRRRERGPTVSRGAPWLPQFIALASSPAVSPGGGGHPTLAS